jgi:Response regulator containing a CheY-like receiver domain and an HD-GYP domain
MALADVYDALRSERPYKPAYSHEESLSIIRGGAGTQFDPLLTGIFLANQSEIFRIASTEKDVLEKEIDAYAEEAYA